MIFDRIYDDRPPQMIILNTLITSLMRERSGSVVECLTRDRGAAGSSLTGVTVCVLEQEH